MCKKKYFKEAVVVSGKSPVLIDHYLKDSIEVDVDAVSDGKKVMIAGIMEHIEEAGIHSGDSTCTLPPYSLSEKIITYNKNIRIDENHEYTIGRYGPVIKCNENGKITFKNAKKDLDINKLRNNDYKLEDIIETNNSSNILIGKYEGHDIFIKNGKFGPYIEWGANKKSLKGFKKNINETITVSDIEEFINSNKNIIKKFSEELSIRKGKYGDYIYYKTQKMKKPKFINVSKLKDINDISKSTEKELIARINNFI